MNKLSKFFVVKYGIFNFGGNRYFTAKKCWYQAEYKWCLISFSNYYNAERWIKEQSDYKQDEIKLIDFVATDFSKHIEEIF